MGVAGGTEALAADHEPRQPRVTDTRMSPRSASMAHRSQAARSWPRSWWRSTGVAGPGGVGDVASVMLGGGLVETGMTFSFGAFTSAGTLASRARGVRF